MVEGLSHNTIEPVANEATKAPDGTDARDPEQYNYGGEIDRKSNAVVLGAEDFDGEIGE